jgi:hypothetical protein
MVCPTKLNSVEPSGLRRINARLVAAAVFLEPIHNIAIKPDGHAIFRFAALQPVQFRIAFAGQMQK